MKTAQKNSYSLMFGITENEVNTICDIVNSMNGATLHEVAVFLHKIFLQDIKPGHLMLTGYLIGYTSATDKMLTEINNSLQLCQRQN